MVRSKALSSIVLTAVSVMVGSGHVVYAADGADRLHTAAARPEPSPISADARNMALAEEWLERFRTASIDRSQLDPRMSSLLTDDFARGGSAFRPAVRESTCNVSVRAPRDGRCYCDVLPRYFRKTGLDMDRVHRAKR